MATLGNNEVQQRFRDGIPRLLHLNITRQNQEFTINHDLIHCDIELLHAQARLVGEPGEGGYGISTMYSNTDPTANNIGHFSPWRSTVNVQALNDPADSSVVLGVGENFVQQVEVDHGHVDVDIVGLTERRQYLKDQSVAANDLSILIPTDFGLEMHRGLVAGPTYMPWFSHNVKLQPRIKVTTHFPGTREKAKRVVRFVQDYADTDTSTYRKANGEISMWANQGHDDGVTSPSQSQFPANLVHNIYMQFKVTPRSEL